MQLYRPKAMPETTISLHNTLTRKLEPFEPRVPGQVGVYVCGPTTYDVAHAGHARANMAFDILVRFLRARGLKVNYVRNVTDVDDKILNRAKQSGEEPLALSARVAKLVDDDMRALGMLSPDHEPRVSETIEEIVRHIQALIDKGHAYVAKTAKGQDVYFEVRSFPAYGKLSHRNIDDLLSGARIEVGEVKKDPLDFALWKGCEETAWGWPSPWGKGRPGWHIECSAMSSKFLGEHFDIHGGGMDLVFPHHENEIAQSEAVYGPPLARYWLHNGFLNADNEKMSKSLGNFVTVKDVLTRNDAEAFRYYLLGTHYRGPLGFELEKKPDGRVVFTGVDDAERRVEYLYTTREGLAAASEGQQGAVGKALAEHARLIDEAPQRVLAALDKDLNTPAALAVLGELGKTMNELSVQLTKTKKDPVAQAGLRTLAARAVVALAKACEPLGLMQATAQEFALRTRTRRLRIRGLDAATIDAKVTERSAARAARDFARGDAIRAELAALGVELLDGGGVTSWKVTI
jgi:cysteinyl-tRNA synthetase